MSTRRIFAVLAAVLVLATGVASGQPPANLDGPTDIACANGMDDYEKIKHVPIAVANIDKGHGGTYWEPNGGAAAKVVIDWLHWQLRGSTDASRAFVGPSCGLCGDPAWEYQSKGL